MPRFRRNLVTDTSASTPKTTSTLRPATPFWIAFGFVVFSAICWAGSSIAGRAASSNIPPYTLSFVRWSLVALCFLAIGWRETWVQRSLIRAHWGILSAFALFGVVGFTVPYYVGLQYTIALNATLMNATGTIWIVLMTFLMIGETISRKQVLGVLLGLLGTVVIVLRGDLRLLQGLSFTPGDILVLVSYFSWALYTVMLRWKPAAIGPVPFLVAITVAASVMMFPLYVLDLWRGNSFDVNTVNLGIIAYSVIFPSFLGYICWNRAVPVVGPNIAGMAQYMIPVFGAILSVLILGESIETYHIAGIAIIFAGVWMVTTGRRKANPVTPSRP